MQNHLKKLEEEVSTWPHVSIHAHRFGGRGFLFDQAKVGHVHIGGIIDIPFPRSFYIICSWQKVLLRSITGFRTQVGSPFRWAVKVKKP
jgi:hypothetical protein